MPVKGDFGEYTPVPAYIMRSFLPAGGTAVPHKISGRSRGGCSVLFRDRARHGSRARGPRDGFTPCPETRHCAALAVPADGELKSARNKCRAIPRLIIDSALGIWNKWDSSGRAAIFCSTIFFFSEAQSSPGSSLQRRCVNKMIKKKTSPAADHQVFARTGAVFRGGAS